MLVSVCVTHTVDPYTAMAEGNVHSAAFVLGENAFLMSEELMKLQKKKEKKNSSDL